MRDTRLTASILIVAVLSFLLLGADMVSAAVEVSGVITTDTTWTSSDTIVVTASVMVPDTVRLSIQAGSIILFSNGTSLFVAGELAAEGGESDRIVFTDRADTAGGSPVAGSWSGVSFQENSTGTISYCDLRYAYAGVAIDRASVALVGCVIEDFAYRGLSVDGYLSSPPVVAYMQGCIVRQNEAGLLQTGTGVYVYRSVEFTLRDCEVRNCFYGVYFQGQSTYAPHFQITRSEIRDHASYGICALAGG